MKKIRCAIYTRKSAEEGLEQEFNSLDAQREACAAYVASQKAEGWVLLPTVYEDAGISGGTLERPGLQRLLADIDAGLVDRIVVYKVDRLTRSLSDFAKLVDRLDAASTGFVSVTQSFNTATSMGRLTLHMLLSFAQFQREVTAERIRDKVAASKRKGLWMGGRVPLGYEKDERTLRINEAEAETVRTLYALYRKHGTLRQVKAEADRLRLRTKQRFAADGTRTGGLPFRRGHLHCLLTNPLYAGRIRHQRRVYEGQHPSIIAPELWDAVQTQLQAGAAKPRKRTTKGRAVGVDAVTDAEYYVMSEPSWSTFSRAEAEHQEQITNGEVSIKEVRTLPLLNINNVMDEHFGGAPTFLSIDAEGWHIAILKSVDYDRFRPKAICIETLVSGASNTIPEIPVFMETKGYIARGGSFVNTIFVDSGII